MPPLLLSARTWLLSRGPSDDPHAPAARLRIIALGTLAVVAISLLALIALEPDTLARRLTSIGVVAAIVFGTLELSRRGLTRVASWAFVLVLVGFVTQRSWVSNGVFSPVLPLYVVFVMMAGFLLGRVGAIMSVVASMIGGVVLVAGQMAGRITPARDVSSPIGMLLFFAMVLGLALVLHAMIDIAFRATLARAEREIQERTRAQTRLDLALDLGEIGVWTYDPAKEMFHADDRTLRARGLEAAGKHDFTRAEWREQMHPDDRPSGRQWLDSALQGKSTPRAEVRLVALDGTVRHIASNSAAVPAPDGSVDHIVGITANITERKLAEIERERLVHSLGERVKELRLLHTTAQAMQRMWDSNADLLRFIVRSIPEAWQYPEITVARISLGDIAVTSAGWRETVWTQSTQFMTGGALGSIEVSYTEARPDADEGPFLKEERALIDSVAEMIVAHLDSMRSRKELEHLVQTRTAELRDSLDRLKELETLRDDLAHMIVHDIRGMLTVMIANLEMISMKATGGIVEDASYALRAAHAMNRMTNMVLDVSRLEEGKMPVNREPTDVLELALETTRTIGALDSRRTITCTALEPVTANCDADLVRRVIENLVSNAVKHTPSGGHVNVDVRLSPEDRVRVAVKDEGQGVPEEIRGKLFEKFAASKKNSKYHSSGLGLAFCRLAVEAHGGTIRVDPGVPKGSVFSFEIPA